jgi:hypothetical protein
MGTSCGFIQYVNGIKQPMGYYQGYDANILNIFIWGWV